MDNAKSHVFFNLFVISIPLITLAVLDSSFRTEFVFGFILFHLFCIAISSKFGYTLTFFEGVYFRGITLISALIGTVLVLLAVYSSNENALLELNLPVFSWFLPLTVLIWLRTYYQIFINSSTSGRIKSFMFLCLVYGWLLSTGMMVTPR